MKSNPVRISGIGLPKSFYDLFDDDPSIKELENKRQLLKNHQILVDTKFMKGKKKLEEKEEKILGKLSEVVKPIK